ncbi:MAG TPA: hypothetical protein VF265_01565 [Nevskiaceae bacterium]
MALIAVGIIILALGIAVTSGKLNYEKKDEVAKVGGVSLSASHDQTVPQWAGIAGIVIGGGLIGAGILRRKR